MSTGAHNFGAKQYGPYDYALGDELRGERATLGKTLLDIQRDLRIKAAYIAAIEDAKPEVFPNPGFIAGYVRSYARYLGLDPDEVFWRFCQESGFSGAARAGSASEAKTPRGALGQKSKAAGFDMPLARHESRRMPEISLAGLGSLSVLLCLLGGLGYGGWMVLQNIQRVQFAPAEDTPQAVAEIDALQPPASGGPDEPMPADIAAPVASTSLADLYRQQELEVPILVPRDGPIAALNPDATSLLASTSAPATPRVASVRDPDAPVRELVAQQAVAQATDTPAAEASRVVVVAERAAWIRVYLANGTVIFEHILEKGETYSPPEASEQPMIWAGNSGSVYVRVGDELRGPLGRGTRAAKDISLDPASIAEKFAVVTEVPETISQVFGEASPTTPAVTVQ